ncbi:esterase/lipase/thioesterase [Botrytis cinerea]
MPLKSDIHINVAKFEPSNTSAGTAKANEDLINLLRDDGCFKISRDEGCRQDSHPKPKLLPDGLDIEIPSRDSDRAIPCRLVYPSWRKSIEERKKTRAIGYLIHGGGWVLGDQHSADVLLQFYADAGDLAIVSVGYRLAPEFPFPCGPNDCIDVGKYLVKNGEGVFGSPLKFIGERVQVLIYPY